MGRYKKKLRAEKAKVKLKKKKLPKGQNITDTSFKVKKIVTVEQLKKVGENEPVSSWNVPLKDLLTHLGHHNKSSRLNALNGIKEIIIKYPGVLKGPLLKNIVMKILEMMGDVEARVRTTTVTLLNTLFSQLSSQEMLGFHEILNLHLTCAMTHRHPAIQRDSLKLADIVIKHAPEAIKQNIKVIMVNFIRLLSSYKYGAKSEIFLVKGSKKDLEENRIAIFQRLLSALKICYVEKEKENENENNPVCYDGMCFSKKIFVAHFKKQRDSSDILRNRGTLFQKISSQDLENDFTLVVSQIMPLLFETWSEFCPNHSSNFFIEECILREPTARLLSLILEIIMVLYESSLKFGAEDLRNLFKVKYGNQIVKSFFFGFPFVPQVMEEKSDFMQESVAAFMRTYESQNLMLCYLAYHMKLKISNNLKKLLDNYILQASRIRNTKCEEILSKIFEFVILSPRKQKRMDSFMKMCMKCYKLTTNARFQKRLLQMLSKVITDYVKYGHVIQNVHFHEWILYLAKGLCKSKIHFEVLEILSKAIQRKIGDKALSEIENSFMDIIKNLPNIEVEGCDPLEGKKCVGNILYWCDDEIIGDALKNYILEDDSYPCDIRSYLINIFCFKLKVAGRKLSLTFHELSKLDTAGINELVLRQIGAYKNSITEEVKVFPAHSCTSEEKENTAFKSCLLVDVKTCGQHTVGKWMGKQEYFTVCRKVCCKTNFGLKVQ